MIAPTTIGCTIGEKSIASTKTRHKANCVPSAPFRSLHAELCTGASLDGSYLYLQRQTDLQRIRILMDATNYIATTESTDLQNLMRKFA